MTSYYIFTKKKKDKNVYKYIFNNHRSLDSTFFHSFSTNLHKSNPIITILRMHQMTVTDTWINSTELHREVYFDNSVIGRSSDGFRNGPLIFFFSSNWYA